MAEWKKVIVSGSDAILNTVTASFSGDGSGLTNLPGTTLDIDAYSALGGTGLHQTQDHFVFSDNGTEKKITFSNLEDAIFGNVSGDATIAAGGALTIANDAVELGMLNDAAFSITASGDVTGEAELSSDKVALSLTIANGAIDAGMITDATTGSILNTIAGDVNVTAGGVSTIQPNAVEGSMLNSNVAGTGLDYSANVLSVDVSDFMTNGSDNRIVTATGTDGQNAEANLTFDGSTLTVTGDQVITGNLTVQGTQTNLNVTDLDIEDRFILLNSGSNVRQKTGIIFGGADTVAQSGSALVWDATYNSNDGRLGVANAVGSTDDDATINYHVVGFISGDESAASTAQMDHPGNIRIDASSDIYIYV